VYLAFLGSLEYQLHLAHLVDLEILGILQSLEDPEYLLDQYHRF
jgi:hypothetical protein